MSTEKSESYRKEDSPPHTRPFEYIVIVEDTDTDGFIHETLLYTLALGNRIEKRKSSEEMLKVLSTANKTTDIPDVILFSLESKEAKSFEFLDKFAELPEPIRAKCKLIVVTSANSKEDKIRALMNPSVIRYLEKPIDVKHFRDFMFS